MEEKIQVPTELQSFMYALMKEARRDSFLDFLENWEISEGAYEEIETFFNHLGVKL